MKMHHKLVLSALSVLLASCSFLFGRSSSSEVITSRTLPSGASLTAIRECGLSTRQSLASAARVRELYVGFQGVKVSDYRKISVAGSEIDRALVRASLDNTPIHAVSYLYPGGSGCVVDLVVWKSGERDPALLEKEVHGDLEALVQEFPA